MFTLPSLGRVEVIAANPNQPRLRVWLEKGYRGQIAADATTPQADGYRLYLECSSSECIQDGESKRKLDAFVEVLSHHDYDRDGMYDADDVVQAIDLAMWQSDEAPVVFERPRDGLYTRLLMRLLSVAPSPDRHIAYSFGELRPHFRKVDYLWALPLLVGFLALVQLQIYYADWTKYSVITGYFAIMEKVGVPQPLAIGIFVGYISSMFRRRKKPKSSRTQTPHTYGLLNRAALYEEQVWREGSHRWNFGQRLVSCVTFGAVHMVNLFYPLATILPLSVAGGVFMYIYLKAYRKYRQQGRVHARRDATYRAALAHRLYNRCALAVVVVIVGAVVVQGSLSLLGVIALIGSAAAMVAADYRSSKTN